ncbi:sensor domain-containing diguanylate cyclase [Desulfovibrio ferrophilus]|uniref:Diguanylate cyclase with PAS/PAC sensor n=1 Tax=Desulfovibrio ferrophilus TaxID=241368 RepID=A0A2Z6B234_9BACT|nr:diguanylate cyclase [Desulfovibrio ferrophilus]BBD09490.1 diguanylate cyclase with PAS/PAC sensor [Desulfovibrio ferrophilus]
MRSTRIPASIREKWQRWTDLLASITKASAVRVALADGDELLLVAASGENQPYKTGERLALSDSGGYCESVLRSADRLSVHDPEGDLTWHMLSPNWKRNPDMERGMVAYLGLPIVQPDGSACGTVSLLGRERTSFGAQAEALLAEFRTVAEQDLKMLSSEAMCHAFSQGTSEGVLLVDERPAVRECNQRFLDLWQLGGGEIDPDHFTGTIRTMAAKTTDPEVVEQHFRSQLSSADEGGLSIELCDGRTLRARSRPARDESGNVWGRVWLFSDETMDKGLDALTTVDAATGLTTRTHFLNVGHQEVSRAKRYGKELSLILMRLDGFSRAVQDHGREAGDVLLAKIAESGQQVVRNLDIFGRLENELLGVLLPETGQEGASAMAQRLQAVVNDGEHLAGAEPVHIKVQVGIATFSREMSTFESLLSLAETATTL